MKLEDIEPMINALNTATGRKYIIIQSFTQDYDEAYTWLRKIMDKEYTEYCKVKSLLPEETWKRYFAWNEYDHVEMKMLTKCLRNLRGAILSSKRPKMFCLDPMIGKKNA